MMDEELSKVVLLVNDLEALLSGDLALLWRITLQTKTTCKGREIYPHVVGALPASSDRELSSQNFTFDIDRTTHGLL